MVIGLRLHGKATGIDPHDPLMRVYHDRDVVGPWEAVIVTSHEGSVDVRYPAANRQLCITPDGRLESRPAGTFGAWEQLTLSADRTTISRAGVTLTVDGDLGTPTAPGGPLHLEVRGHDFVDAQGQRIVYPAIDGFDDLWFRIQGREAELDALMVESHQVGMKVRRIWCMGDAGENQVFSLYPQHTTAYFDWLRSIVTYENGHGIIPLFTCFVDAQRVMPNQGDRQRFWMQCQEALSGIGAYLWSGGNQYPKNGFDPWADLADPGHGVIWSRGSSTDDLQTPPRGAPASELHATRNSFDRALMDSTASPPEMRKPANGSGMVWMTEGMPFGDAKGYSEQQARQLGCGYSILWALAVHHNRQSQRGQLMHDDTARTAAAWATGMTRGMILQAAA